MIFAVGLSALVALLHLYLWKRLVRDITRPGRVRRVGGLAVIGLAVVGAASAVGGHGNVRHDYGNVGHGYRNAGHGYGNAGHGYRNVGHGYGEAEVSVLR